MGKVELTQFHWTRKPRQRDQACCHGTLSRKTPLTHSVRRKSQQGPERTASTEPRRSRHTFRAGNVRHGRHERSGHLRTRHPGKRPPEPSRLARPRRDAVRIQSREPMTAVARGRCATSTEAEPSTIAARHAADWSGSGCPASSRGNTRNRDRRFQVSSATLQALSPAPERLA